MVVESVSAVLLLIAAILFITKAIRSAPVDLACLGLFFLTLALMFGTSLSLLH